MSKYFKTSDGEEFYTENHAYNHARSLKDKAVTPPDVAVEEDEEEVDTTSVVKLSDMTKKELIAFAEASGIKINPKDTNATMITVIEAALAEIAAGTAKGFINALNIAQQGQRGGQAAILQNRATGNIAKTGLRDIARMKFEEAGQRAGERRQFQAGKATRGQSASYTPPTF